MHDRYSTLFLYTRELCSCQPQHVRRPVDVTLNHKGLSNIKFELVLRPHLSRRSVCSDCGAHVSPPPPSVCAFEGAQSPNTNLWGLKIDKFESYAAIHEREMYVIKTCWASMLTYAGTENIFFYWHFNFLDSIKKKCESLVASASDWDDPIFHEFVFLISFEKFFSTHFFSVALRQLYMRCCTLHLITVIRPINRDMGWERERDGRGVTGASASDDERAKALKNVEISAAFCAAIKT